MFRQYIYYFISVVEKGDFSSAGKQYYLSQSAISQQIAKLEQTLGFKLFDRQKYRPQLTEEGEDFYHLCKKLVNTYEKEMRRMTEQNARRKKTITVGITSPFEKKHVPRIAKEFKKEYDVSVNVKSFDLQECMKNLQNRSIDVGFGLMNDFESMQQLSYSDIYESHICIVTSFEHPLARKETVSIEEIKEEPIVILSRKFGENYYEAYMKAFELDGIVPHIAKEVNNLNEFIVAIQLGEGIGLSALEVISENDGVSAVLLEHTHHRAVYGVGWHSDNDNPYVKEFTDVIIQYFEKNYRFQRS